MFIIVIINESNTLLPKFLLIDKSSDAFTSVLLHVKISLPSYFFNNYCWKRDRNFDDILSKFIVTYIFSWRVKDFLWTCLTIILEHKVSYTYLAVILSEGTNIAKNVDALASSTAPAEKKVENGATIITNVSEFSPGRYGGET